MGKSHVQKRLFYVLTFALWLCESVLLAQTGPGIITTVAGLSTGFSGDGGPATEAEVFWPDGVFVDPRDNYYIADFGNARIRRVDTGGIITTVAGNGRPDFSGDGNLALSASLFTPSGVFADDAGNLYIADRGHDRIRWVHGQTGLISTIAGSGSFGFDEDGIAANATGLAEPSDVFVIGSGSAAGEFLNHHPYGGTIYIADRLNHRIRKVNKAGIISTVVGTGEAGFGGDDWLATSALLNSPEAIHIDKAGNLYIADAGNNRIRKVNKEGIITTVAGSGQAGFSGDGGPASKASLWGPLDVSVDGASNLYIADTLNQRIRRVDGRTGIITTVAGSGPTGDEQGELAGDGGLATETRFANPRGVCVDKSGSKLYIADTLNHRIRLVTLDAAHTSVSPDFDGNGRVDFQDFVEFALHFGLKQADEGYEARYDLDLDGEIGFSDFVEFAGKFGEPI